LPISRIPAVIGMLSLIRIVLTELDQNR
jgi:hypothetical protein